MQQLALRTSILLNDLTIKTAITDLAKILQESKSLNEGDTALYSELAKVFLIKTSSKVQLTVIRTSGTSVLDVTDTCLLTDAFISIEVENVTPSTTAEIFVVCG